MKNISRRTAIKTVLAGSAAMAVSGMEAAAPAKKKKVEKPEPLKGNIRHSVSKWCFGSYPLDEFCEICKNIGIESIELLDPKDWPIVQKHGLTVAMAQGAGLGIDRGFNDPKLHDELVASYEQVIPMVAEAGLTNLICFAGRRNGVTDLQGWENCEKGLKRLMPIAVSKWCFGSYPLDEFCEICKNIGIESIELLDPKDWPIVQKHGLTVAMAQGAGLGIDRGFNDPKLHDELVASYEQVIPMVAEAGLTNLICFAGRRNGVTDLQGWENCEKGLKRLMPIAEKYNVVLTMELLNSVGHKDYLCDHTVWGAELCRRIGSPNFKLLYDIYHMQIMEGNVIEHIRKYHQYFSHIHTGGVPGRAEIDETQELYYPAIMKAIVETGYKGFVGQEFVPKQEDKIASLEKCIRICDV